MSEAGWVKSACECDWQRDVEAGGLSLVLSAWKALGFDEWYWEVYMTPAGHSIKHGGRLLKDALPTADAAKAAADAWLHGFGEALVSGSKGDE